MGKLVAKRRGSGHRGRSVFPGHPGDRTISGYPPSPPTSHRPSRGNYGLLKQDADPVETHKGRIHPGIGVGSHRKARASTPGTESARPSNEIWTHPLSCPDVVYRILQCYTLPTQQYIIFSIDTVEHDRDFLDPNIEPTRSFPTISNQNINSLAVNLVLREH